MCVPRRRAELVRFLKRTLAAEKFANQIAKPTVQIAHCLGTTEEDCFLVGQPLLLEPP